MTEDKHELVTEVGREERDEEFRQILDEMVERHGDTFRRLAEYDATGADPGPLPDERA